MVATIPLQPENGELLLLLFRCPLWMPCQDLLLVLLLQCFSLPLELREFLFEFRNPCLIQRGSCRGHGYIVGVLPAATGEEDHHKRYKRRLSQSVVCHYASSIHDR